MRETENNVNTLMRKFSSMKVGEILEREREREKERERKREREIQYYHKHNNLNTTK